MEVTNARYSRNLFVAFASVVIAFIVGTVYANWRTFAIGAHTQAVSENALPSIEHLVAANDALRDIEAASAVYPGVAPAARASARASIEASWQTVDVEVSQYLRLPAFDGERDLCADLPADLRAVNVASRELLDAVDAPHGGEAVADVDVVRAATTRASRTLLGLTRFNVQHAHESTTYIDTLHDRVARTALVLDGIAVLVAILATARVWALFRVHTRLLQAHGDLLERRASELEGFGKRVAHDLLSPLSALTYCLSAFKRASESSPELRDAVQRARACVQRAQTMVSGIFEFSRAGGRPVSGACAQVREAIDQVAEEVCTSEAQERPEVEVAAIDGCAVACSRGVLVSILTNLMRNAAKFMRDSALRQITVRVAASDATVRIEVHDTGPGIPPEILDTVFEPYVRAEGATQPGLGLGLATVKRLCVAHGGVVGVESTLGRGSVFWFTLPRAAKADAAAAPPSGRLRRVK
jgi:signal transduction histidine kinase